MIAADRSKVELLKPNIGGILRLLRFAARCLIWHGVIRGAGYTRADWINKLSTRPDCTVFMYRCDGCGRAVELY